MSPIKSRKHDVRASAQALTTASLLTGFALALPAVAAAQQTPSGPSADARDQAVTLDRIDVHGMRVKRYSAEQSASPKFTQPLVDTTQTVNIIASDLFNEQGATSLTDALRNSPGVGTFYVGENGNTTTGDAVYLRGFDTSGSIFVDGIRDLGSVSRDVFNIEQIEVTKGPSGPDNGRTAPTGAINLVSKQPMPVNANAASLSYGSDRQRRVTADLNRTTGADSALRINLMAQDSDVPGRDVVKRKRWAIAPSVGFGLGGATRFYVNLLHVDQDNVPDGGVPTIGLPGYSAPADLSATPDKAAAVNAAPRVDPDNFYGTHGDHDDVGVDMLTARFEHDLSERLQLQNTSRWGRTEQDYQLTSFMLSTSATPPAQPNFRIPDPNDRSTWAIARSLPTFKDQQNRILTNQTNLRARLGDGFARHELSAGVEFTREQLHTHGVAAIDGSTLSAANLYAPDANVAPLRTARNGAQGFGETETASVYAFDTLKLGERWQLNAGARYDDYTTRYENTVVCGLRGGPVCGALPAGSIVPGVDARLSDTLFNWKAGVLYKPTAHGSLYADYAISKQPPGGGTLELSASANSLNNVIFDPQEAKTAEAGVKWNLFGDALLVTGALYDTRISNEIIQDADGTFVQNGSKRVRGVELSAVGNLSDAWSVSTGFTTMDTDVITGPAVAADGSRSLTYTPKTAFTSWTTYRFPFGLTLGGGARYSGELRRGTDGATGTPAYTESYWVFDAVATYAFNDHLDLRLNVYNLLDEDYVAAINKSGYRYSPGTPRSALLTANIRF